jgi:Helix-turn-helix domain
VTPTKRRPPAKKPGAATGRRTFNGATKDVASLAARMGVSEKALRAQVARGLIPYRRFGGRIIFLADEVDAFLRQLPGVTVEQALANVTARNGTEPAR